MSYGSLPRTLSHSGSRGSLMGAIKGGGRLYAEDPLAGYSEQELIAEAKDRIEHNRQRRRMKQLLSAASDDGFAVRTKDLLLAAKLANMSLPDELVAGTPYATVRALRAAPSATLRSGRAN